MIETPGFFFTIIWFLAAIGPLIFVHEMGHYLAGRICGVKADVFAIGFGRELFGWTDKRGTRWKLCLLPLGGYVKFAGDLGAASEPDEAWKALPEAERNQVFQAKSVGQRAFISFAGPATNLLVAALIFMALFAKYGELRTPPVVQSIAPQSVAAQSGFQVGDRITAINGRSMEQFSDIGEFIAIRAKTLCTFEIERGGKKIEITAAPAEQQLVSRFGTKMSRGLLGIGSAKPVKVDLAWHEIPGAGFKQVYHTLRSMVDGLGQIIMGYVSVKELGGPVMIAKLSGEMAAMGWLAFVNFVALISINLGFINLLPIPTLDGGHLFFNAIEAIRRKPVAIAAQEWAYRAGFLLLMGFMLFVTINDFVRFGFLGRLAG